MYMTFETLSLIFQLYSLGELCGLMPEDDIQPTSEQLKMIIDFTSGMGIADDIYSGMRIADDIDSGMGIADDIDSGMWIADDIDSGMEIADDIDSGMGIADDIDSGNLIRTFSTYDTNKYFLFVDNYSEYKVWMTGHYTLP